MQADRRFDRHITSPGHTAHTPLSSTASTRLLVAAVYLAILLAGSRYAYLETFSLYAPFDDEGTFLLFVRAFVEDTASYDSLDYFYGPFFYLTQYVIHTVLDAPFTHEFNRLKTVVFWMLIALVAAIGVHRFTRSLVLAAITQMQVTLHLTALSSSPGHPQEIALLLLSGTVVCASLVCSKRFARVAIAGLGLALGALLLVKVNLGIFMAVALALSFLPCLQQGVLERSLLWLVAFVALALPAALMWRHLQSISPEWIYALVVTLAAGSCLIAFWRRAGEPGLTWGDVGIAALATVVSITVICMAILALGGSVTGIIDSVLLRALRVPGTYHHEVETSQFNVYASMVAIGLALAYHFKIRGELASVSGQPGLALAKLCYGCISLYLLFLFPADAVTLMLPLPFAWLVLVDDRESSPSGWLFARLFLCLLAIFQTLQAYPVPGAQQYWTGLLLIPLAVISIGDGIAALGRLRASRPPSDQHSMKRLSALGMPLVLCLAVAGYYRDANFQALEKRYARHVPLNLPGTARSRIPREDAEQLQALVSLTETYCDTLLSLPGIPSLYFWARLQPPAILPGDWTNRPDDNLSREIIQAVGNYERPCAVRNRRLEKFWSDGAPPDDNQPLIHYITTGFKPAMTVGDYIFMIDMNRPAGVISGSRRRDWKSWVRERDN